MGSQKISTLISRSRESLRSLDIEIFIDMFLSLEEKYQQLGDYVRELVTEKCGKKNERFDAPGQRSLLAVAGSDVATQSVQKVSDSPPSTAQAIQKRKSGHSRNELPADIPRVPVLAPPPSEADLICACCNADKCLSNLLPLCKMAMRVVLPKRSSCNIADLELKDNAMPEFHRGQRPLKHAPALDKTNS
jgi:hypothetical protein